MKPRVVVIIAAVVVPLAVLGVVVARSGSGHGPARLPILASGSAGTADAAALPEPALYPYGGVVYKVGPNLPVLDGSAHAYKVAGFDASVARRLADAFGFTGIDPDANNTFTKGDEQLSVATNGYWGYVRQSSGGGSVSSSGAVIGCAPNEDCPVPPTTVPEHPADLPSQDDAKPTALSLLRTAGIDTTNADVSVDDAITQWLVRVDPNVDGVPTDGFTTTVTVGENSVIEYANGVLGTPQRVDDYPLIGTSAAIDRLNKGEGFVGPRPLQATANANANATTAQGGPVPDSATASGSGGSPGAESGSASPPAPPASDSPLTVPPDSQTIPPPPPPQEITITGVQVVLLFAASYSGDEGFLVPAYRFSTDQGEGPTVLAIDDKFLTPPDQLPVPVPQRGSDAPDAPGGTIEPKPVPATATDGGR